jgi:Pentapeptide repeats (8 copies)
LVLFDAELQRASLDDAQLQGALLNFAQLQGASLFEAHLQGASLWEAQLQGASLDSAQLQCASLAGAQLQGATLDSAELEGASLQQAQLQGASLELAQLQGASLQRAQLQGASLQEATLNATDLSRAGIWRTNSQAPTDIPKPAAILLSHPSWEPSSTDHDDDVHAWDDKAYQDLRKTIEALPAGNLRDRALENISRLNCVSSDKTLEPCAPGAPAPSDAAAWRQALERASVKEDVYRDAVAKTLQSLVCSSEDDALHVVRGVSRSAPMQESRLDAAGAAATGLIADLMHKASKDCPVAAALIDADRARLLQIKREIEAAGAKPAAK